MNKPVQYAVLRALKDRLRDLEAEIGAEFLALLEEGDTKAANLEDGTRLGKISKTRGRMTPTITDHAAFLKWVKANYPTEVEEAVRPAFRDKIFDATKRHGVAVDENTGELIPGVDLRIGDPFISFRGERGYQQIIAEKWQELATPLLLDGTSD